MQKNNGTDVQLSEAITAVRILMALGKETQTIICCTDEHIVVLQIFFLSIDTKHGLYSPRIGFSLNAHFLAISINGEKNSWNDHTRKPAAIRS